MINEKKKITRGEFLSALGGIGLAVVAAKFAGINTIANVVKPKTLASKPGSYGNNVYGGKNV